MWTAAVEEELTRTASAITVFPGMMFSLAKEHMEATKLWRVVQRMPKGALLHTHLDAMVGYDFMLDVVLATPGMHLLCDTSHLATAKARGDADAVPQIRFRKKVSEEDPSGSVSIWRENYVPGTPVPLVKAAEEFPDGGRREGFLKWMKSKCTLSQTDAVEQHHGVDAIWRKFRGCFMVVGHMLHYEPIFRAFLQQLMTLLVEDGLQWVELRYVTPTPFCPSVFDDIRRAVGRGQCSL